MAATRNRGLNLALAGIALLFIATLAAYRPAAPLGPETAAGAFSAYRAQAILQDLVGDGVPHPLGSAANARLREAIVKRLSALGYATELQSGFVCNDEGECGSPVNIVATLSGGSSGAEDIVLLAAHYDSVPAGPGASDDGAGVASVLEIARILATRPAPRHRIALLLTDGEEAGILGARLFVHEHPLAKQVKAAVNLDARGTSGPSFMFETGTANTWLMHLYGSAIARPITNSLYYVVYKLLPNDTDFTAFKSVGYQGFNFAFIGHVGRYHTPLDNVANANAGTIQQQGDNALAVAGALANSPTLRPSIAESTFFDVFARTLIAWPADFTPPAALVAFILLLAEAAILLRKGAVTGREVLWGWLGTLSMLLLGAALCMGALALGIASGKVPTLSGESWISQPAPMQFAVAAIALLAAGLVAAWLWRRAGFWGFWVAAALFGAALSIVSACVIPGGSFVLLLTAIAAGLGALPFVVRLARSGTPAAWSTDFAALLPTCVVFGTAFPQLRFLYMALGSAAWPISTLILDLGAASLLPLLAIAGGRALRRVIVITSLIAAGGILLTLSLPTYSAEWPERINLEHWLDADTGQSQFLARCDSMLLPASLAAAARFDPVPRPRFAGSAVNAFFAAAPKLELAAPELTLTQSSAPAAQPAAAAQSTRAAEPTGAVTHLDLRLRTVRGAPEVFMVFPASAGVKDITLATPQGPLSTKLATLKSGATLLDIYGLGSDGVAFGVDVAGPLPVAVQVLDQSYELKAGEFLQRARPQDATSSQDGDVTVVHRTVTLNPAAGR